MFESLDFLFVAIGELVDFYELEAVHFSDPAAWVSPHLNFEALLVVGCVYLNC